MTYEWCVVAKYIPWLLKSDLQIPKTSIEVERQLQLDDFEYSSIIDAWRYYEFITQRRRRHIFNTCASCADMPAAEYVSPYDR